ncbi:MAG: hypothetical protein HKN09_04205 [Saprospiraceae bacterium]|nr:hypothetical protein [Saprospiraceae bacterium]
MYQIDSCNNWNAQEHVCQYMTETNLVDYIINSGSNCAEIFFIQNEKESEKEKRDGNCVFSFDHEA